MSLYRELSYDHDFEQIKGIQFCVLSPDEIEKRSVAEIFKTETYNGNLPVHNGLFDPRMGVIDYNQVCVTCEQKNTFCPGHFGHIKLEKPVFYVQYFDTVRRVLKCVCTRCSKLLVDPESAEVKAIISKKYSRQKRWEAMYKLCSKKKRCGQDTLDGCGAKVPTVTKESMLKIGLEWKDVASTTANGENVVKKQILNAEDVLRVLRRISDRDAELLGFHRKFTRPEWMICTVLPVPPPTVRPSVRNDAGVRQEDDLTHWLLMIIKANNQLKAKLDPSKNASKDQIDMLTMLLQWEVATMIDNTMPGIPPSNQRTGRPMRSLTERLKSKEGRIRGNLMGKRVDFSARSVITPDPNISIDELGVPIKIAMNLTFPEIVTKYNIREMLSLVKNGPEVYPGAKTVRKNNGAIYRLKSKNPLSLTLEEGDVVDRHLRDGDVVLFNRQPSLHRMSMMCHRVRVMPFNTFRLNVTVTPAYNADFDGDEMNAHVPQSLQTAEELRQLAAVSSQIISPRECKPIISVVQDICSGLYRLTKSHVRVNEKQLFNLMCPNPRLAGTANIPLPLEGGANDKKWSGCQVLSMIMPDKVNVYIRTDAYNEDKTEKENRANNAVIEVKNGQVICGNFSKDVYQAQSKGIVHQVFNEYGPDETRHLFDNTQQLICNWLVYNGFSVGISDMVLSKSALDSFKQVIHDMKVSVYDIIADIHKGKFENKSKRNMHDFFEETVNTKLNGTLNAIGKKGRGEINEDTNRLINMIKSKSKGNDVNVAQMMGCVGQQNVDGKRIPYGFDDRTLPHYTKYDDGPQSRGFISNSFISGLTPQEFFFAAMGGREGLIDTAVQTSETGYIQRKLVKAMEDCKVHYDMTVRNASGNIIQFLYGEDGMDACKVENQSLFYINMKVDDMIDAFSITSKALEFINILRADITKSIASDKSFPNMVARHMQQLLDDREHVIINMFQGKDESKVYYPIGFQRILTIASNMQNKHGDSLILDLDPRYVLETIDKLCNEVRVSKHHAGNHLFQVLVRLYLSPKKLILKYKLSKATFDYVVQQIKYRFYESLAHPSEMVGVIAAQSIGEPATQLTLNTFHLSGVSAASKAVRGVPRLNELLSVSKSIKAPSMLIYLDDSINMDHKQCIQMMNEIRTTRFKDIIKSSRIYFDPDDFNTNIPDDRNFIDMYKQFNVNAIPSSPWLLRLEFDRAKMHDFDLDMITLHQILDNFYDERISCVFSDDNSDQLIMRIKLMEDGKEKANDDTRDDMLTDLKALEHNIIENVVIRGVKNIERASLADKKITQYNQVTKVFDTINEFLIYTDGSHLKEILAMVKVDASRTISNDVIEVFEVLGIEAARQVLYNEIVEVLDNIHVNYRHIALLVDVMTNRGNILSVNRHGINRGDIGPLAKCSFEETTDKLIKAGIFAEFDKINGVAANVMLGQVAPAGTGDVDVLIDEGMLMNRIDLANIKDKKSIEIETDSVCTPQNLNIVVDVPVTKTAAFKRKTGNRAKIVA